MRNLDKNPTIINNTKHDKDCYESWNKLYGQRTIKITQKMIDSLSDGQAVAANDEEYATFIVLVGE